MQVNCEPRHTWEQMGPHATRDRVWVTGRPRSPSRMRPGARRIILAYVIRACLCALLLTFVGCEWDPIVRPAAPVQVAEGDVELLGNLRVGGSRLALIAESGTDPRLAVVDVDTGGICRLPAGSGIYDFLPGPPLASDPTALQSVRLAVLDVPTQTLGFFDEQCQVHGPMLPLSRNPTVVAGPVGNEEFPRALVRDEQDSLWLLDPWLNTRFELAQEVDNYSAVPPDDEGNLKVWTLSRGQLVLYDEAGREEVRIGENVTQFVRGFVSANRIAYVDGGDLFEAIAPDYEPRFYRSDVCNVAYRGSALTFYNPCQEQQYARFDLLTGEPEAFAPGVFFAWATQGWELERAQVDDEQQLFVTPPGSARQRVQPYLTSVQVLGGNELSGTDPEGSLGVWSVEGGFVPVLRSVTSAVALLDARRDGLLWLVHHNATTPDTPEGAPPQPTVGDLSLLQEGTLAVQSVATDVIAGTFTVGVLSAGDVIVGYLSDQGTPGAELSVRLIPELLGDVVDNGVGSFEILQGSRVPELLYTVRDESRRGLWRIVL